MKKLIYLLCVTFLILQSCSSGDSSSNVENTSTSTSILCKKTITNNPDGEYISTFTYDGNKIVKKEVSLNNIFISKDVYTYNGSLIVKKETFNKNNQLIYNNIFNYLSNNLLESETEYYPGYGTQRIKYTYVNTNTISYLMLEGDVKSQNFTPYAEGTITTSNNNISGIFEYKYGTTVPTANYSRSFTYDVMNNPFKNVLGLNKLFFESLDDRGFYGSMGFVNNIIKQEMPNGYGKINVNFTYNSNDYPISAYYVEYQDENEQYFY